MDIQQLKYYRELCRVKNFTEAGFVCSLSQSALSKQIRRLEKELNVTLIRRNTRKFELTEAGEIFLEYAGQALERYEKMLEDIHSKKEIHIGSMTVLSPYHFAKVLAAFHEQHPDIDLVLDEHTADQIVAHMDEYDFAILRTLLITDTERYCMLPLYDDYLCAVVYSSHPLAGRRSIRLEELKDEVFVFPQKGSGGYEAFYDSCVRAGFTPDIEYEFPQANTIMSFVQEKMGVTINFTKVYQEYAGSGLCMIPLEDAPHYPISLIYPKSVTLTEAQRTFLRFLRMWKKSTPAVSEGRTG